MEICEWVFFSKHRVYVNTLAIITCSSCALFMVFSYVTIETSIITSEWGGDSVVDAVRRWTEDVLMLIWTLAMETVLYTSHFTQPLKAVFFCLHFIHWCLPVYNIGKLPLLMTFTV